MRSVTRCRRRQRGLYAAGGPHKGLLEVEEARFSGLHAPNVAGSHPHIIGFSGKMLYILEKNVVYFGEKKVVIFGWAGSAVMGSQKP